MTILRTRRRETPSLSAPGFFPKAISTLQHSSEKRRHFMTKFQAATGRLLLGRLARIVAAFAIAVGALAMVTYGVFVVIAQSEIKGQWTAEFSAKKSGRIQITFIRRSEGGSNMMGESLSLSELQGLSPEASNASDATVSFNIVREAGTFACEGAFRAGKGAGFWTFTPNGSFVSAMQSRGYGSLSDDDLLRAAMHNLTTKYIDELKAAGYDKLTFEQVSRGAGHDVTVGFIREMQSIGYSNLTMEELIRARNHEIDSQYAKEVQAMGFD